MKGPSLTARLADNEAVLLAAYRDVAKAVDAGAAITPTAQWLIDNFHVVEKQIREVRVDLPGPRAANEVICPSGEGTHPGAANRIDRGDGAAIHSPRWSTPLYEARRCH